VGEPLAAVCLCQQTVDQFQVVFVGFGISERSPDLGVIYKLGGVGRVYLYMVVGVR
jgi:hypothetical protein